MDAIDTFGPLWLRYTATGDEAAFAEVYNHFYPQLVRRFHANAATRRDATDHAEEFFLELIRHRDTYDAGYPLGAWIFWRFNRRIIDYAKRVNRHAVFSAPIPETGIGAPPRQEDDLLAREQEGALALALRQPENKIIRRYSEGTPKSVIAADLGISEMAVTLRIRRGVVHLQRRFKKSAR